MKLFYLKTLVAKKRFITIKCKPLYHNQHAVNTNRKIIPSRISTPTYYLTGLVEKFPEPKLNSKQEIDQHFKKMSEAGLSAGFMRMKALSAIKLGKTAEKIDEEVHACCVQNDFYPAAMDYKKFPKSVSISVNQVACHGIPNLRPFEEGDVVKVDCISYVDGYYGDCCGTCIVGQGSETNKELVKAAKECVEDAIKICGPGVPLNAIGQAIQKFAKKAKVNVVKEFAGHAIGKNLHSRPFIYHFDNDIDSTLMKVGMTFTIEPILTFGSGKTFVWADNWTVATEDSMACAQFEETIFITEHGCEVLTRKP